MQPSPALIMSPSVSRRGTSLRIVVGVAKASMERRRREHGMRDAI
jgi:hypothetical protein